MESPQEIEVWYVLPALRKALAEDMLSLGLKQREIAKNLHVTEAAISQYLRSKRATELKFPPGLRKKIKMSAVRITGKESSLMGETKKLCDEIRDKGLLCRIHKKHSKMDLRNCEVCGK